MTFFAAWEKEFNLKGGNFSRKDPTEIKASSQFCFQFQKTDHESNVINLWVLGKQTMM